MFNIRYGIPNNNIDVTDICYNKLNTEGIIFIPSNDHIRSNIFTDPVVGYIKSIFINNEGVLTEYSPEFSIFIDTVNNRFYTENYDKLSSITLNNKYFKLECIHKQLTMKYGDFNDEYPEQLMAVNYLTGNEKVLELGSNIGRNSLVIGSILSRCDNNNFVTLECNLNSFNQLEENRKLNNLNFHSENSALSKQKLIQRGWNTIPFAEENIPGGWEPVNIIDYYELINKYNIKFDTLVVDCEGAFYYILRDMPEILVGVNLVIMENDYSQLEQKVYVDYVMKQHGLEIIYSESGGPGCRWSCCPDNFYEVWKKNEIT